jgi:hypothetical protein
MKITKGQLRQIIQEEFTRVLSEQDSKGPEKSGASPEEQIAVFDASRKREDLTLNGKEFIKRYKSAVDFGMRELNNGQDGPNSGKYIHLTSLLLHAGEALAQLDAGNDDALKYQITLISKLENLLRNG